MVKSFAVIILLIFCTTVNAQTISVGASTDTTDYLVGDFIHYEIQVVTRNNVKVIAPSLPDTLTNLELISREEPVVSNDEKSKSVVYRFTLAGYDSVTAVIPAVQVEYRVGDDSTIKKIETDSVVVHIHTMMVSTAEEIKDVKSPLIIAYDWRLLLLWIGLGILVLVIANYFYKKYKKKKAEQPVEERIIVIPPHVKAFRALENLEQEQLWQKGKIKEYHSRITEIVRLYFAERFDLHALELTTSETMLHLRGIKESEKILDVTFDFLSNADLVKFAKFQPLESVNEEMMKQARNIVQSTILEGSVIEEEEEVSV
jgi:hypothetical protein